VAPPGRTRARRGVQFSRADGRRIHVHARSGSHDGRSARAAVARSDRRAGPVDALPRSPCAAPASRSRRPSSRARPRRFPIDRRRSAREARGRLPGDGPTSHVTKLLDRARRIEAKVTPYRPPGSSRPVRLLPSSAWRSRRPRRRWGFWPAPLVLARGSVESGADADPGGHVPERLRRL